MYDKAKSEDVLMLLEYQNEIIGLLAIMILLVIYLVLKIQKLKKESTNVVSDLQETQRAQDLESLTPQKNDIPQTSESETSQELDGSCEGEFALEEKLTHNKRKSDIFKRDVPKHEKITKESFKEFAGSRLLVAEDNLINQKVISGLLADSGIDVVMANDGQEALDILKKDSDFLMILMDAHMPRIDGFEATRMIRANPEYSHIVVVALSGDTAADDIKKMQEAGMAEQLEKPLRMDSLYDVLYAYSGTQNRDDTKTEGDIIEVPITYELDGERGLEICGGDENFYLEILHEFITTYADSADRLREHLLESQMKQADKLLLDVIGVAANIGADRFTKVAKRFKESLQDTDEKSYFTNLEQYQKDLSMLVKDIKEYIKK